MMELVNSKQTRMFVPFTEEFSNDSWREEILGSIIKPLIEEFSDKINWFWFSKYIQDSGNNADKADTNFELIKSQHPDCINTAGYHRSIRFRINVKEGYWEAIEKRGNELIGQARVVIADWRDYDVVGDLGSDRFSPPSPSNEQRKERAYLVVKLYESISKMVLATLVKENEKWQLEYDVNSSNVSDALHHLFCNISDTSPIIKVEERNGKLYFSNASYQDIEIEKAKLRRIPF